MPATVGQTSDSNGRSRAPPTGTGFKRTYKACDWCRKTKAKCELDESSPSCLKCQRERRECVFPAYRSAKRAKIDQEATGGQNNTGPRPPSAYSPDADYHQNRQTGPQYTSLQHGSSTTSTHLHGSVNSVERTGLTERSGGKALSTNQSNEVSSSLNAGRANPLQDQVVQTVVASSSDAVGLLFRAANATESEDSGEVDDGEAPETGSTNATDILSPSLNTREPVSANILSLWNQHRFVRQGWFTAREAVAYVHAFFTKHSPLSPVLDSFYADPANHQRLILEEPLLCCTILMISSRHHYPPGTGGAVRADYIHGRLWRHIEHLVQRITFGSEKYSIGKSRTLGSIQALLLITEWHPRTIHFPPEYDGWDSSLAPSVDDFYTPQGCNSEASKRWREDVFEPAKRSDRLSWMLVGLATTLAHELGIFRTSDETDSAESSGAHASKLLIRRFLYLYVTQLSLRLGCTSIFPQEALQNIGLPDDIAASPSAQYRDGAHILSKWIEITKLMATAAEVFFSSRAATKQMLRSTRYLHMINHFQPLLEAWYKDYSEFSCPTSDDSSRKILLMEYYYARMYIHSVAIQALVERISSLSNGSGLWQHHEIWRSKHAQDFASVNEVRESSGKILTMAVELSEQGVLQYCPVRVFLRVVSASVFLLKSMSLGSRETDIVASLKTLDTCIVALQTNRADDIHLSSRYATLIARHVQRFKRNFQVHQKSFDPPNISPLRTRASSPIGTGGTTGHQHQDEVPLQQDHFFATSHATGNVAAQTSYEMFPATGYDGAQGDFTQNEMMEDWLSQPFNPNIAPFGVDYMAIGGGIAVDSLDFLWNIGDPT